MNHEAYRRLVALLRSGVRLPEQRLVELLATAGRSYERLAKDVLASNSPQSGSPCEYCGGTLRVRTSKAKGCITIRYLQCGSCKQPAGRRVIPSSAIRRRKRKGL